MRTKNIETTRLSVDMSVDPRLGIDMLRVMSYTDRLVELAMSADWLAVLESIDARRKLLQTILACDPDGLNPQVTALSEAVSESERALMRVVAHAIASLRTSGGLFAIYH